MDVPALKRLWIHEVLRVYYDRLIDDNDRHWMYETVQEICNRDLEEDFHELLHRLDLDLDGIVSAEESELGQGILVICTYNLYTLNFCSRFRSLS